MAELLGRGGMAEVHAALDRRLGRRVAVKLLRSELGRDPSFQARFRREAQSTALVDHPAVVTVYDSGEDVRTESGGAQVRTPYIVMELVAGRTVRELLDEAAASGESGLGAERAVEITAGVLTALQAAHDAGIVHRDVKPANVMVTPTGGIKVMDFGIARAVADSSLTLTHGSAVVGTAQYLSPEQARGEAVDARTDLYSVGCLLHELLTGRPPFTGESALAVVYQHVGELPAPPSRYDSTISDQLDRVVLTALSKQRDDRQPDALAFRDDLLAALAGTAPSRRAARAPLAGGRAGGVPALPPGPRRGRRRAAALAGAVLVVGLALGGWSPDRAAPGATTTGRGVEPRTPVLLTTAGGSSDAVETTSSTVAPAAPSASAAQTSRGAGSSAVPAVTTGRTAAADDDGGTPAGDDGTVAGSAASPASVATGAAAGAGSSAPTDPGVGSDQDSTPSDPSPTGSGGGGDAGRGGPGSGQSQSPAPAQQPAPSAAPAQGAGQGAGQGSDQGAGQGPSAGRATGPGRSGEAPGQATSQGKGPSQGQGRQHG
nr:protein kinase [Quadrisphaera sp. RL12-1S]